MHFLQPLVNAKNHAEWCDDQNPSAAGPRLALLLGQFTQQSLNLVKCINRRADRRSSDQIS